MEEQHSRACGDYSFVVQLYSAVMIVATQGFFHCAVMSLVAVDEQGPVVL